MKPIAFSLIFFLCFIMASCSSADIDRAFLDTVEVFTHDQSRQCEPGSGISLDVMEKELAANGIAVLSSRKGTDGKMHIAVCGSVTGIINIFEINENDLAKAGRLGFKPVSEIEQ